MYLDIINRPVYQYYIKQKEHAQFWIEEFNVIFLILSSLIWLIAFFIDFKIVFTFVSIQIFLFPLRSYLINRERNRKKNAEYMLELVEKSIVEDSYRIREKIDKGFDSYEKANDIPYWEKTEIEVLLRSLLNPNLDSDTRERLIDYIKFLFIKK